MPTNPFFSSVGKSSEGDLIQQLTDECIKINGYDLFYIPRDILNMDYLYHEDMLSRFKEKYPIEMILLTVDFWDGEGDIMTKFGVQVMDTLDFEVSKERFNASVPLSRPQEGDLLFYPVTNTLMEITWVEPEKPFYQMGKLYVYKISCGLFRYSSEEIDTGILNADLVQARFENNNDASTDPFADNQSFEDEVHDVDNPIVVGDADDTSPFGDF